MPKGCAFSPRCSYRRDRCAEEAPAFVPYLGERTVRCHFVAEIDSREADPPLRGGARTRRVRGPFRPAGTPRPALAQRGAEALRRQQFDVLPRRLRHGACRGRRSLSLPRQTTLGLVGESGCGKSTLLRVIAGLEAASGGVLEFDGQDISVPIGKRKLEMTKRIQVVFQDPRSTLNPRKTIGQALMRPIRLTGLSLKEADRRARALLESVNLGCEFLDRYPEQISGGQKQRIAIARAFASNPDLILCDEPTSSLDVSIQASIINLLLDLQREKGTTYLFISHALGVVSYLCDTMAVMYLGTVVEYGPKTGSLASLPPLHRGLTFVALDAQGQGIAGSDPRLKSAVPSARDIPSGCRFHTRCPRKVGGYAKRRLRPGSCRTEKKIITSIATFPWRN